MSFDADQVIETFQTAAEENKLSSLRQEQVVHLPDEGEVWMTGDMHDNRTNFANPSGDQAAASSFLIVTAYSTSYTPRKAQIGLRYEF